MSQLNIANNIVNFSLGCPTNPVAYVNPYGVRLTISNLTSGKNYKLYVKIKSTFAQTKMREIKTMNPPLVLNSVTQTATKQVLYLPLVGTTSGTNYVDFVIQNQCDNVMIDSIALVIDSTIMSYVTTTLTDRSVKDRYRFGFNGGEKMNEIYGVGNYVDLGERGVDVRLGRLNWSVDPLAKKFPSESNYSFAGNNPIALIDEEGKKKVYYLSIISDKGFTVIKTVNPLAMGSYKASDGMGGSYTQHYNTEQTATLDLRGGHSKFSVAPEVMTGKTNTISNAFEAAKDAVVNAFDLPVQVMVFGNGTDYEGWLNSNPAAKAGKKTFTIDMKEFDEVMGNILMAKDVLSKPKIDLGTDATKKLLDFQDKANETADYYAENEKKVQCPKCSSKMDSSHVDDINGKGTYDKLKSKKK
jgi:hypothetical protein